MQYKQLTNPSFTVLMMEVQDHLREGWTIDENNYPMAHIVYYEVNLIRDEYRDAVKDVFDSTVVQSEIVVKKSNAGRPARNKQ